ncbi:MAG: protein kinase [Myxococcota bacterium]
MPRLLLAVLLAFLCGWMTGCGMPSGVPINSVEVQGHTMAVPGRLDGAGLERGQTYRIEASVELPEQLRGRPVDLSIPLFEAHPKVWADGEPAIPTLVHEGYREVRPQRWAIPASATEDGQLDLAIDVEYRWTKGAWLTTTPYVVPAGEVDPRAQGILAFNIYSGWAAFAVLFQVGATCLLVFFLDRRRRPYLWFGIQAICAMAYPAFAAGFSPFLFGTWDLPVVALGLCGAILASLRFTHSFYGLGPVPRWIDAPLWFGVGISLIFVGPFEATTYAAPIVAVAVSMTIVYQFAVLGRLFFRSADERISVALLASAWITLGAGTWGDLVRWIAAIELYEGPRPACVGLVCFALFLSLVLSRSHIRSLANADDLNTKLARRVDEVEAARARAADLNEELREQIADRSAQLFAALGLIESDPGGHRGALRPGMEINGRYRVERVLGSGAMGMVYLVMKLSDGSRWAMKIANEVRGAALARLAREAHIASKLRHDNVVEIRDIDVSTMGFMYIVLELVEGRNLGERLRRQGPPPFEEARRILEQVARGLAALHEVNIAHRDLKPDNVLLAEEDGNVTAKIADFGISKVDPGEDSEVGIVLEVPSPAKPTRASQFSATVAIERPAEEPSSSTDGDASMGSETVGIDSDRDRTVEAGPVDEASPKPAASEVFGPRTLPLDEREAAAMPAGMLEPAPLEALGTPSGLELTGKGLLMGTPHYIAPELTTGRGRTDPRADLFSFGVMAHEVLTGTRPFAQAVSTRLLRGERLGHPKAPRLPPQCKAMQPIIDQCLSFDPAQRPTAAEAAEALARIADDEAARDAAS